MLEKITLYVILYINITYNLIFSQPLLVANLSHASDAFSYRACNVFCPYVVIPFWDGYTCVGIPLSVIEIGMWRYHFELYILMSFVLSLHLPPCFSYLIFLSSQYPFLQVVFIILYHGCWRAHYIIHMLTLFPCSNLLFGATEYTTSINIWSAGCILAILLG